jgi:hypothetical protein
LLLPDEIVWNNESSFIHVTVVPTATDIAGGEYAMSAFAGS